MPMKWNVIIGLALIVLAGCRKESTTWNSRYAVPLAHGSLTLDDIVPDSLLEIDEAGMWHLVFHESLTDIDVDSLATIPDTTIKQKFVIPFNSGTLTLPAATQVFSDAIETQLGISGAELKYARMKSGMMHYTVKSYLNGEMTSQFELPGVTLGPSHVLITADTDPEVGGVPGLAQGSIDMTGYTIDLTGDSGNESNKLASNIVVSVSNDASTSALINGQDSILVELTFDNAQVEWAEGYFGNHVYQINEDVDFAGDVNMPTGVMYVEQARMNLDITNYIGADARLQFADISASNAEADLALEYSPIYQALNITRALEVGGTIYPFSTSYMINETNSNFTSFIGMLPSSLHVDAEIEINPLGNISGYHDFIYADKALEANLTIDVPLRLSAGVTLTDTLEVTIGEDIVASGELIFIAENYFPLDARLQLKLVDGEETLLLEDGWIDAGIPGGEPGSSTPVRSEVHVPVSYETIQRLKDGDRMFVRVGFYTPNIPELYALYANYKIDFKLVADATVELEVH